MSKKIGSIILMLSVVSGEPFHPEDIKIGSHVPDFNLRDQRGNLFKVADYLGKKNLVIYFYPKDESLVCTKEACSFRDHFEAFEKAGAIVIGINSGSVASHKKFMDNHRLNFTLLSDPGNTVMKRFGVKGLLFMSGRETFVVNREGMVINRFNSLLEGEKHVKNALTALAHSPSSK